MVLRYNTLYDFANVNKKCCWCWLLCQVTGVLCRASVVLL